MDKHEIFAALSGAERKLMFGGAKPWASRNVTRKPCRVCEEIFQPGLAKDSPAILTEMINYLNADR